MFQAPCVIVVRNGSVCNAVLLQSDPEGESSGREGVSEGLLSDDELGGAVHGITDVGQGIVDEGDDDDWLSFLGQVSHTGNTAKKNNQIRCESGPGQDGAYLAPNRPIGFKIRAILSRHMEGAHFTVFPSASP